MANGVIKFIQASFPALQHRNYRLFWLGQCVSLIGTWMQTIGQSWLVLQLTGSAWKLSVVASVQFLPMTLFSLYAGPLADRYPKRKVLLITSVSLSLLALILASLTYFEVVQYWHIIILAFLLGLVNTLEMTTRQSFVIELVGRKDLMNAIALNSGIFNLARIIGPAFAGLLIGILGIAICFYLNALSFIAVIAGLWLIRLPLQPDGKSKQGVLKQILPDIKAGIQYIKGREIILLPLLLLAVTSIFMMNFNVIIPIFAQQSLGQGAAGYGFLMTSMGSGSFIAAMLLATGSKSGPRMKIILGGALGMSAFMVVLGFLTSYFLAAAALFVVGFCMIVFTASVNSMIQINSADRMRGRVMSVYTLFFGGAIPIGSLYAGFAIENFGVAMCMIISGIIGIAATSLTYLKLISGAGLDSNKGT